MRRSRQKANGLVNGQQKHNMDERYSFHHVLEIVIISEKSVRRQQEFALRYQMNSFFPRLASVAQYFFLKLPRYEFGSCLDE